MSLSLHRVVFLKDHHLLHAGYWSPNGVEANKPLMESPDAVFGVAALAEPRFQAELACLLGEDPACPAPDIVLVNSGYWDQVQSVSHP